ncbi:amidohydrolase family protein [Roseibium litorale]|uniref:Amidohydrolase n=1 Tax=Roseibium litorale TaxID=2803841 RepID=A0ABR9CJR3_9HYPH|nr:amidohydrolase [Roseibium litorale]MBD8890650.1 amidohydrolase [Roseibium litorale]
MLIDTHLHLVDRDQLSYPWLADVPALDRDWTYDSYETVARRIGISGALHMEVDVHEDSIGQETEMVGQLMNRPGSLIKGAIASGRPESPDFAAYLDSLDRKTVKGLRRVLHVVPDDLSQARLFRKNIRRLASKSLPFDICMLQRQLPLAAALVDAAPDVVFVLDHCGVPEMTTDSFADWKNKITELSKRPNLNIKISGIVAYTGGDFTLERLRPYVEYAIGAFGWNRVVWGSDSPVCTLGGANLETWVASTYALTLGCSADERTAFFSENARRIWQLD